MGPSADTRPPKRRRLDETRDGWQAAAHQVSQASQLQLPEPSLGRYHPIQPQTSYNAHVTTVTSTPNPTAITWSAGTASVSGGETPWPGPFQPTTAWDQAVYSPLSWNCPLSPHLQLPHPSLLAPLYGQAQFQYAGAQQTQTSYDIDLSFLPSSSTSIEILCPTAARGNQEQEPGSHYPEVVSPSGRNGQGLANIVCFGRVRNIPRASKTALDGPNSE